MDLFIPIATPVVAIFVLFYLRKLRRIKEALSSALSSRPPPSQPVPAQGDEAQSRQFDQASAKHLHHGDVLTGPAWVVDGDTIRINKTQIRLFGIDAPELNHPYGMKAKWALHKLCKGCSVRAEITETDRYGRAVAICFLADGRDLSAEMVKAGLALDWPDFSGGKYRRFEAACARKKLFLADARQKGRMHVWHTFESKQRKP